MDFGDDAPALFVIGNAVQAVETEDNTLDRGRCKRRQVSSVTLADVHSRVHGTADINHLR
jgi:hypothetical protein